jgi:hypothetical protein
MTRYSLAMNRNPASDGSAGCSRCDEVGSRSPIRRIASRRHSPLRSSLAVRGAKRGRWCRSTQIHYPSAVSCVASASPSMSSATMTNGLPDWTTASRFGTGWKFSRSSTRFKDAEYPPLVAIAGGRPTPNCGSECPCAEACCGVSVRSVPDASAGRSSALRHSVAKRSQINLKPTMAR